MISSGHRTLHWSWHCTSHQNFSRDVTAEVRPTPATLQVTSPVPHENAAATHEDKPCMISKWLLPYNPKPCLEPSGPEVSASNEQPDCRWGDRECICTLLLAALLPESRDSCLQCHFLPLYHMQIPVILTKVWSQSASQPKSHLSGRRLALQPLIFLETPGNIALNLYCKTKPTLEQINGSIPWCID